MADLLPPRCPESEGAVLVAALTQRADLDLVVDSLGEEDFTAAGDRAIWRAVTELHKSGMVVDIPAVQDWLLRHKYTDTVDPDRMQMRMMASSYVSEVAKHVRQVRQFSQLRKLQGACYRIATEAYRPQEDIERFVSDAEAEIYRVAAERGSANDSVYTIKECVQDLFTGMQREIAGGGPAGVTTGLEGLDRIIGRLLPGQLTIVAARPSMGKTALLLNIAAHVASFDATPALGAHVISLESPRQNVAARVVADCGSVNIEHIAQRKIQPEDFSRLTQACKLSSELRLTVDDRAGLTLSQIRSSIRRAQARLRVVDDSGATTQKLGLVCLDYLQLVRHQIRGGNREQEVGAIAYGLLEMAREFDVPVIALAQLSRECEKREDKRPRMADLRDSGAIEQAANVIVALYRDEYYNPESADRGLAEAIVLKSKDSRTGAVKIVFEPQWMRFSNLDPEDPRAEFKRPQKSFGGDGSYHKRYSRKGAAE